MSRNTLYIIDVILTVLALFVLATSVLLEILGGESLGWLRFQSIVLVHVVMSLSFLAMSYIHIREHFKKKIRFAELFSKLNKHTKWLFVLSLITLLTGIVSAFVYFSHGHTPIGGIHGKIAFAAIALMIGHLIKRIGRMRKLRR